MAPTFKPYTPTDDDPIVDNPQPQQTSQPQEGSQQTPLQGSVTMWNNISDAFKNGVEIPEGSIPDKVFKAWNNNPVGSYLNEHLPDELPYLMPNTALSLPISKAIAPVENFIAQRTTMPLMNAVNPYLQQVGDFAKNSLSGINSAVDNTVQNAGNYLLDKFGGNVAQKTASDSPIGLGQFNFEPPPAPDTTYSGQGVGRTDQVPVNPYSPNFRLTGNDLVPTGNTDMIPINNYAKNQGF